MSDKIYVIGHRSPDLDSASAAVAYAALKNKLEKTDVYTAALAGEANRETVYVFEKFGISLPERLDNAAGKKLILVDHNEFSQAVDGVEEAELVEVLDHHKIKFESKEPIAFYALPWGASCSIIASLFKNKEISLDRGLAGLMLSAILVDTVITKSPTCTDHDREIIEELAGPAGVEDWRAFGMEIFKIRSSVSELGAEEIIRGDFKDFELAAGKFGIGQVETVDLGDFASKEDEIANKLEEIRQGGSYHSVILFITDILKEGSKFLVATGDQEKVEEALGAKLENGRVFVDGVISRKKQVAPMFMQVFDK
jgi:manganese-dependent inorganic pyrophosphatase